MKTGERFVIYGVLLLLVGANLSGLFGATDRTAVAQEVRPAATTRSAAAASAGAAAGAAAVAAAGAAASATCSARRC